MKVIYVYIFGYNIIRFCANKFMLLLYFLAGTLRTQNGQLYMAERDQVQKQLDFEDYRLTIAVYACNPLCTHTVTMMEIYLNFKQLLHT
jgi:hypothetical protein